MCASAIQRANLHALFFASVASTALCFAAYKTMSSTEPVSKAQRAHGLRVELLTPVDVARQLRVELVQRLFVTKQASA